MLLSISFQPQLVYKNVNNYQKQMACERKKVVTFQTSHTVIDKFRVIAKIFLNELRHSLASSSYIIHVAAVTTLNSQSTQNFFFLVSVKVTDVVDKNRIDGLYFYWSTSSFSMATFQQLCGQFDAI